jgi:glycosyltransferase involved in cell wall biosynthesis
MYGTHRKTGCPHDPNANPHFRQTGKHTMTTPLSADASLPPLSACIITFNEADRIADCLHSLAFCDDIVVVDSGSTDGTAALAEALGARVLVRRFDGFRSQKAFAVEQAAHDWVLCLDADERVSDALRAQIQAVRAQQFQGASGYVFPRLSWYFGRFLRHGTDYPDRVLRLFDRRCGGWRGGREIHESASVDGPVQRLRGDLLHYPFRSLLQMLDKLQRYAAMMAEHDYARGKRASLVKLLLAPGWRFFRSYVLKGGFLDGMPGLLAAWVNANYVRQKAMMLWLLQHRQPVRTPRRQGD